MILAYLKALLFFVSNPDFVSDDPYIRANALREIHGKCKFPYFVSDGEDHSGSFMVSRSCKDHDFYFGDFETAKMKQISEIRDVGRKISVTPEDPEFGKCLETLKTAQSQYQEFLDKVIKEILDVEQLTEFANDCLVGNLYKIEFYKGDNEFEPVVMIMPNYPTFEDILETFGILSYFFNRQGKVFSYIRKCRKCEKFFLPANPKAFYCSEKCRGRQRYLIKTGRIVSA